MLAGIRSRLTYANVVSTLCLFILLGGGAAWAAAQIDSGDVKDNSLKSADLKDGKGVKAADVAPGELVTPGSEGWHAGTLWGSSACSWHNYGNGHNDASYFRDPAGIVHLRGLVVAQDEQFGPCNFASNPVFREFMVLPPGYRPEHRESLATISNNAPARVNLLPESTFTSAEGAVEIEPGFPTDANAKQWVSIDGLSFRCGPSGQDGCP